MRVIMSGGGTGGHIYPAIAIADKIKRKNPNSSILFVGTEKGMESRLVPENGYEISYISAGGLNRKNLFKNLGTMRDLMKGCSQAGRILADYRPDLVIGTGGYVSVPVLWAAVRKKVPVYIHEQNAFPGLANRMLGRYAKKIFISFPESERYFKQKDRVLLTGNPVRKEFILSGIVDYRSKHGIGPAEFMVLSFGGSRGAEKINQSVLALAESLSKIAGIKLIHITGTRYFEEFRKKLNERAAGNEGSITVLPYTDVMHEYMLAADLVICRSGAITVAELTACGKPSILIPSPNVTANHQYHNAKSIADGGGGILIEEKELTEEKLTGAVMRLINNREALNTMAAASSSLGRTDGADAIFSALELQS
ncbi:undecaprenyldiphospho-muramoylpentapeptide beta-N-acetylglucosaminyltransferase [Bacillota bacterium]